MVLQKRPNIIDGSQLHEIPLAKIKREVRGERRRKAANAKLSELRKRSGRNEDGRVADGIYLVDKPADFTQLLSIHERAKKTARQRVRYVKPGENKLYEELKRMDVYGIIKQQRAQSTIDFV